MSSAWAHGAACNRKCTKRTIAKFLPSTNKRSLAPSILASAVSRGRPYCQTEHRFFFAHGDNFTADLRNGNWKASKCCYSFFFASKVQSRSRSPKSPMIEKINWKIGPVCTTAKETRKGPCYCSLSRGVLNHAWPRRVKVGSEIIFPSIMRSNLNETSRFPIHFFPCKAFKNLFDTDEENLVG